MRLTEAQSFESIWNNTALDEQTTFLKLFRKIGFLDAGTKKGFHSVKVAYLLDKNEENNEYRSIQIEFSPSVDRKLADSIPLFDISLRHIKFGYLKDEEAITDYKTSDLVPNTVKKGLEELEDFLLSKVEVTQPKWNKGKDYYVLRKPAKYVEPEKTAHERYDDNAEARSRLLNAGVPEEFFKDWWLEYHEDGANCSGDGDDDEYRWSWGNLFDFTFTSKKDRKVWYLIGVEMEMYASAGAKFYPGRMYMSNGDPGYPDEYDVGDPEFYDADYNPALADFGEKASKDDPVVADLVKCITLYCDSIAADAEKHPDDYFYD